ncbi:protein FAM151B-like isoform X2 [Diachasmimorpha longicaudata]|uniref:protein FAM151B-like isoform X2 n=1 Tax=Diachasmimorpha longicaudata TaxID=58733 RepID=UPI0030B8A503
MPKASHLLILLLSDFATFVVMELPKVLPVLLFVGSCWGRKTGLFPAPKDFFADRINGNLTKITWAHQANSKEELDAALNDQADVSLGEVDGNPGDTVPIMAHPPDTTSDLSLGDFLSQALETPISGIKLDFKTIEAFKASLPILKEYRDKMLVPIMLNADILPGPFSEDSRPVDADEFLQGAKKHFPKSTLSVGWTTKYGITALQFTGSYTKDQIENMIVTLKRNRISQPITYPVRAALAADDIDVIKDLMKRTKNYHPTLTIWSPLGDFVDRDELSALIKDVGVDRTYVDVPKIIERDLSLGSSPSRFSFSKLFSSIINEIVLILPF